MEIILEGKDYEELVTEAAKQLEVAKDELRIEVLETKKSMFGQYLKIKATKKEAEDECAPTNGEDFKAKIDIQFREDGVYIMFNCISTANMIKEMLIARNIDNFDQYVINREISSAGFDKWVKVAPNQEEKTVPPIINIQISKDLMRAIISITQPYNAADITEGDIIKFLNDRKITYGIKMDVVKEIVSDKLYYKELLIAEGLVPHNGQDAYVEFFFDTSTEKSFKIDEDGRVNFKEQSMIKNVEAGAKLAKLTPSTLGTDGINILGLKVPGREGKRLPMPRGKNVEVDEDGVTLKAGKTGEVKLIDNRVSVFSVYEVKADVDPSTGNIRFMGKVIINGNVLTGFEIEAEGDIEVYGVVEGAKLTSNGNIVLHRGILGTNQGEIICKGDLVAKFIENCKVHCEGNITSDAIMQSSVLAGKKIEVTGKKGLIVGGTVRAGEEIIAKVIGSPMATVTEVEVGLNPDLRKRYDDNKMEMRTSIENLEKSRQVVDLLTKMAKQGPLPEDKKLMMSKSVQLKLQMTAKIEQLKREQTELETIFEDVNKGKIKVMDTIYPGCRISIGSSMMYIKDPLKFCMFYRANAEIKLGTYEG